MQDILLSAKLVGKEVRSLQRIVADKPEGAAVKLIRSALGDDIHLRSGLPAKFG